LCRFIVTRDSVCQQSRSNTQYQHGGGTCGIIHGDNGGLV
jgi:hypothetical protein